MVTLSEVFGCASTLIALAYQAGRIVSLSRPDTAKLPSPPILLGMKQISALISLIAVLALASCAHHGPTTQTTQTTTTTGYTK